MKVSFPPTRSSRLRWTGGGVLALRRILSVSVLCSSSYVGSSASLRADASLDLNRAANATAEFANLERTLEDLYTTGGDATGLGANASSGNEFATAAASLAPSAVASVAPSTTPRLAQAVAQPPQVPSSPAQAAAPAAGSDGMTNLKLDGYMKDRVKSAEKESEQLRQLLRQADTYENGLWSNISNFKASASHAIMKAKLEVRQVPKLKQRIRKLAARVKETENLAMSRQKDAVNLQGQLYNASRVAERSERALKWAQLHLQSLQRQNSGLLSMVRNETVLNHELALKLNASIQNRTALATQLQTLGSRLFHQNEKTHKALKMVEDAKLQADHKAAIAEKREREAESAAATAVDKERREERIVEALQQELQRAKLHSQIRDGDQVELEERRQQAEVSEASSAQTSSKLKEMSAAVHVLEKKTEMLKKHSEEASAANKDLEHSKRDLSKAMDRLKVENKQLRGASPWLDGKLQTEGQELEQARKDRREALQERDALKAMLKNEQQKVNELEQSYADSIQVMGKSYENQQAGYANVDVAVPFNQDATPEADAQGPAPTDPPANDFTAAADALVDNHEDAGASDAGAAGGSENWGVF